MSNNTSDAIRELLNSRDYLSQCVVDIDNVLIRKADVPHTLVQVSVSDTRGYYVRIHLPQDALFAVVSVQRDNLATEIAAIDAKLGAIGSLLGVV
jgi:hypothetical protein